MLEFPDAPIVGQSFPPFMWDGAKWARGSGGTPSSSLPLVNGIGTAGDDEEYTRGDHVHPIDPSRAPVTGPAFTGGVNADTMTVTGAATVGPLRSTTGRIVAQGNAAQPSASLYATDRNVARGYFLDTSNYLAFGDMDAEGNPLTNVARFDNTGHIWLNGTAVLGRDPGQPMEAASKQYVDGRAAAAGGSYAPLAAAHMWGPLYPYDSPGSLTQGGGAMSIEIQSAGGHDACLTFHRPGAFACNFGLASDHNFWYGGWSFGGGVAYRFWTTRDFGGFPISNERLVHAGDYTHATNSGMIEPWASIMSGSSGQQTNGSLVKRYRYWQVLTTGWWTVGFA